MPIYATGITTGAGGFNMFTFANVAREKTQQLRYIATLLVQWICTAWLLYNIRRKVNNFVSLRQEFITSDKHANTAQAKTLLITGIPQNALSETKLKEMYSHMPGGVAKVWINRDLKDLPDLFDERLKWCGKLESAEASLISKAYKKVKKGKVEAVDASSYPQGQVPLDVAEKYITKKERPTHKINKKMKLFGGEKVDSLSWYREEIARLTKEIDARRAELPKDFEKYPSANSAFILFNQQIAAHMAAKTQAHHLPYRMNDRYLDAHPNNVVWGNLNMNPYEKKVRTLVFWAITIALVLFWSIPVGFLGVVSNVKGLAEKVSWLSWLNKIGVVTGIIQSLLPTILLAVLNMLLPIFLRLFASLSGVPTRTGIELSLMDRFFLFQIVQNFLFMTIVSGSSTQVTAFVGSIVSNPSAFPGLIATAIPKGSTFFLSYIALQGLTGAGSGFMQIVPLAVFYVKKFLLGSTPRALWHIENNMPTVAWGTLFPLTSLISIIAIGYLVIAPIVSGFAFVTFVLYWLLYRYNFLYVYDQKPETETSGLFFPKAINQLFVALYLELVMLAALFFLANAPDPSSGPDATMQTAIPEGAFTVVLIVVVAAFHYFLSNSYNPLYNSLPLSLVPATDPASQAPNGHSTTTVNGQSSFHQSQKIHADGSSPDEGDLEKSTPQTSQFVNKPIDTSDEEVMTAFDPPSTKEPQRELWFPNDKFGMGTAAVGLAQKQGLEATNRDTHYDEKNRIATTARVPPGETLD